MENCRRKSQSCRGKTRSCRSSHKTKTPYGCCRSVLPQEHRLMSSATEPSAYITVFYHHFISSFYLSFQYLTVFLLNENTVEKQKKEHKQFVDIHRQGQVYPGNTHTTLFRSRMSQTFLTRDKLRAEFRPEMKSFFSISVKQRLRLLMSRFRLIHALISYMVNDWNSLQKTSLLASLDQNQEK